MPLLPRKILIVRNDKLGDFTLSLPSFALLKASLPDCRLSALVPAYTRDIAELCPAIDEIILDPGDMAGRGEQLDLSRQIRDRNFDAALTLYSTTRVGWMLWRNRIPHRFAPATKLAQVFYNHRYKQRRSLSLKPEYQYNLDLSERLLAFFGTTPTSTTAPPYIQISTDIVNQTRAEFYQQHRLDPDGLSIFVHPGHGGSANNLNATQYSALANKLDSKRPLNIIVSAGPGETTQADHVVRQINRHKTCLYESRDGLTRFVHHIAFADIFISGSTGPLHVAGALNRPTCGFYTNRRSATSLRWQTLSTDDRRLAFSPPSDADPEDMNKVDLDRAAIGINDMMSRLF